MKRLILVFVVEGVAEADFEAAGHGDRAPGQIGETMAEPETDCSDIPNKIRLPLWTWFIPNPSGQPGLF
jgi:hypothetical protein